jgi:hypothetical protein
LDVHFYRRLMEESCKNKAPFRFATEWCFAGSPRDQIGDFAFGPK